MAGHGPGSSLKEFCDLLSALGKVSRIMPLSQTYGLHRSNMLDKIIIEHNVEMALGPLLLSIRLDIAGLLHFLFCNPATSQ